MRFAHESDAACRDHVTTELVKRGIPEALARKASDQVLDASEVAEEIPTSGPDGMGLMRVRSCWVIRDEDLDLVGTLMKYCAPVAGGAAAFASATGAVLSAPVVGAIAAVLALAISLGLNWRRKGVELDPLAICTLAILKVHKDGVSASDLSGKLQHAIGQPMDLRDVESILESLKNAKLISSGGTVAVAFERRGRWFSAA